MSERVLVTGGRGFIGRHALPELLRRGYEVHAVTRSDPPTENREGIVWHRGDLLDRDTVCRIVEAASPNLLLHFAWYTEHGKFWHAAENLDWLASSLELLQAFVACGGRRFVGAGTCVEYDLNRLADGHCREEETPSGPQQVYGASKHAFRIVAEKFCRSRCISFAWGRIFHLYGAGEFPDRFVPTVIRALLAGREPEVSHCNQRRDFMDSRDMGRAFAALLDCPADGVVNMASGRNVTLREIVEFLCTELGGRARFGALPVNENDPAVLTADTKRLFTEVGFSSSITLEDGLRHAVAWWNGQRL